MYLMVFRENFQSNEQINETFYVNYARRTGRTIKSCSSGFPVRLTTTHCFCLPNAILGDRQSVLGFDLRPKVIIWYGTYSRVCDCMLWISHFLLFVKSSPGFVNFNKHDAIKMLMIGCD